MLLLLLLLPRSELRTHLGKYLARGDGLVLDGILKERDHY